MLLLRPMGLVAPASATESAAPWPEEQPVTARIAAAISDPNASAVAPSCRLAGAKGVGGVCSSASFMLVSFRSAERCKRKCDNRLPILLSAGREPTDHWESAPSNSSHLRRT